MSQHKRELISEEEGRLTIGGDSYRVEVKHYDDGTDIVLENGNIYSGTPMHERRPMRRVNGMTLLQLRAADVGD